MSSAEPVVEPLRARGRTRAVSVLLVGSVVVYGLLESMLIPALPLIQHGVGASAAEIGWVLSGLLLAGAVSAPVIGRLADVRDRRAVLLGVFAVICAGIACAGLATSIAVLAVGQALQGVGLGLVPLAVGILRDTEPPEKLRTANGVLVGSMAVASAAGVLLAGPLLTLVHYTWLYWLALLVLVPLAVLAAVVMPAYPPAARGRVDWAGAILLGIGLVAVLLGLTFVPTAGWTSPLVLGLAVIAAAALAAFVAVELRIANPLVDLRLGSRVVAVVCLISFVVGFAGAVLYLAIPTIVATPPEAGYGLGSTPSIVGLVLFPLGALGAIVSPFTGRLERLVGSRTVMLISGVLTAASGAIMLGGQHNGATLAVAAGVLGVATGIGLTQGVNIIALSLPPERVASVTGVSYVIRSVGGAVGAQVTATVMATDLAPNLPVPSWGAITTTFFVSIGMAVLATALAGTLPARLAPLH